MRDRPIELLARLSALVPPPRDPLLGYHGVFAPNSPHRRLVVPPRAKAERPRTCPEQRANGIDVGAVRGAEPMRVRTERVAMNAEMPAGGGESLQVFSPALSRSAQRSNSRLPLEASESGPVAARAVNVITAHHWGAPAGRSASGRIVASRLGDPAASNARHRRVRNVALASCRSLEWLKYSRAARNRSYYWRP
jgi:hypothetical protein